ncbi:hypothetical protein RRG08_030405 [Elysia crispata]|uniref:Uncharacterized protein n=1 Tax=Elysia crispata TaxID=231223 RepID=A0AAE1CXY1_9GAST|nr:hypothetical protein RRG08_030405 [Elysia crispata]
MVESSTRAEERNRHWLALVFENHFLSATKVKSKRGNKSIHPLIVMRMTPSDGQENMRDEGGHFSDIPWTEERNWLALVFENDFLSATKLKSERGNKSIHPLMVMRMAPSDGQGNMRDEGGHFSRIPSLPICVKGLM